MLDIRDEKRNCFVITGWMMVFFVDIGFAFGLIYEMAAVQPSVFQETDYATLKMILNVNAVIAVLCVTGFMCILIPAGRIMTGKAAEMYRKKNVCIKRAAAELKNNVLQLQYEYYMKERANKAKSKFMNRMSHDLRTPMNAIIGYSLLLDRCSDDPDKVAYYANKIKISGQTLMELINDVLDMSSIESGNVRLVNNEFSIISALEEVKSAIRPQTKEKNQSFNFYITNSSDKDRIIGDKQRFCQILRNLLSNATKYTPEGGTVDMIVNIIETKGDELQFLCQIKDTGCGMSEDFVERVFHPFEREDNAQNDNIQGTGLGMSIAKSFVELMNGQITVESKLNVGTLATVRIPLIPAREDIRTIKQMFRNQEVIKGLRFLAAEDNESNAEILQEVLSAMGAECVVTGNGQEVVETFEASGADDFDIILMDIQMPIMNGYQATAALRKCSHPRAEDIIVLAMTADAFEEDVQKAFVSGMNGHVAKPLDLQAFINTVAQLDLPKKKECVM